MSSLRASARISCAAKARTNRSTTWHGATWLAGLCSARQRRCTTLAATAHASVLLEEDDGRPRGNVLQRSSLLPSHYDKEIASVALPALATMLLEPIMGAVSSAFVGQLGTPQLGAVSVGSLSVSFCTFLFSFLLFLTTPEVAAAVAKKDADKVSKIAARGLWVAASFGVVMSALTMLGAEAIVGYLNPQEPAVAAYAIEFIKVRAVGIVPALMGFVAVAVFRGHKDTRTPLRAAGTTAVGSLFLNVLFLYGFEWGVFGSALATTLATCFSFGQMLFLLVHKGMLKLPDLAAPPSYAAVAPMLRAGLPLATRNVISFGMVMFASMLCVRAGSAYQASFEVVRQVWILTIQFFECLNVATQALCSSYLGAGDVINARGVMLRLANLGVLVGIGVGVLVFAGQEVLARLFTSDIAVIDQVMWTLPMVAMFLPLDALASIMDGSLMAGKQTDYLSFIQIAGSSLQYFALVYLGTHDMISTLSIWCCLKMLTIFRLVGGFVRNFASSRSAYLVRAAAPAAAAQPPASLLDEAEASSPAASHTSMDSASEAESTCIGRNCLIEQGLIPVFADPQPAEGSGHPVSSSFPPPGVVARDERNSYETAALAS